jgi:putative transcriptional regulator
MKKQYCSEIAASVHETADGLYEVGLMDKRTMREFDELCLTKIRPLTADEIRNIRERENISQVVFAHYLNVTKGIISQWERGEKRPSGTSLKLLSLVEKKGLDAIA